MVSLDAKPVPLLEENERVLCLTQPCRTIGNGVEHRSNVGRRGSDHSQNGTRGSLLLERFAEIPIALPYFLKLANILYCDHRLIGKGVQEIDLPLREGPDLEPADDE